MASDFFGDFSTVMPVTPVAETRVKASQVLEMLDEEGRLPSIVDWDGSTLEGYRDMLGLNGRPVRDSAHGMVLRATANRATAAMQ